MATDQSIMTRNFFMRTIQEQQLCRSPIYAKLLLANRLKWKGGEKIERPVDTDATSGESLAQAYSSGNTPMTTGVKYPHAKVEFPYKKVQFPVEYDVDEWLANKTAGNESKLMDIVTTRVKNSHKWLREYHTSSAYSTSTTESSDDPESIVLACGHSRTYGGITTTTAANTYWNGASIGGGWTDSGTDYGASINTFRRAYDTITQYADDEGDIFCLVPSTIFRKLRREAEAKHLITGDGPLMKFGHTSLMIDGVEVIREKWLEKKGRTTQFFMLKANTWEYRIHPDRSWNMTPFRHLIDDVNGLDKWLARILWSGNLVNWQPNANIYLSNLS